MIDLTFTDTSNPSEILDAFEVIANELSRIEEIVPNPITGATGIFTNSSGVSIVLRDGIVKEIR